MIVPAGAVERETKFQLSESSHMLDGKELFAVSLHATRGRGKNTEDNGANGFLRPVILCVDYTGTDLWLAEGSSATADLVWFRGQDRVLEAVDGYNDGQGRICGDLEHFSLWGLAWPS